MQPSDKALVPFVSVDNMMRLVHHVGVEQMITQIAAQIEADFKRFNAQTKATLSNSFCGFTFEEILEGTSLMGDPTMAAKIYLAGETSNIYQFNTNSQLNKATIREMTFGYESISPRIGEFGDIVSLDADAPLVDIANSGLAGELQTLIQNAAQNGIDQNLPYKL